MVRRARGQDQAGSRPWGPRIRTLVLLALVGLALAPAIALPTASATSCVDDVGGAACFVVLRVFCAGAALGEPSHKALLSCALP